jgi:serine hydrolase
MSYVTVPGIDGSDERHWQTLWEAGWGPSATRIKPDSWTNPDLDNWCRAITTAVTQAGSPPILIAHSLGCLAVAHWLGDHPDGVAGVFLVAPPDPSGASFPAQSAPTFTTPPTQRLQVPGLVLYSENDPYCEPLSAQRFATQWALPHINVGPHGHLNSSSSLETWEAGRNLLTAFTAGLTATRQPD